MNCEYKKSDPSSSMDPAIKEPGDDGIGSAALSAPLTAEQDAKG